MTRSGGRVAKVVATAGLCALFVIPVVFMATGSLRPPGLPPPDGFEFIHEETRWANYRDVFLFVPLWSFIRNSLAVVVIAVPITVLIASWAGYAIAVARPRSRKIMIVISLLALMVPVSALWIPRFVLFEKLGLTDTIWPLVATALMATSPFYVLIFAVVYMRIPAALFEAARLEGLSSMQVWRRVAWPLGRPAVFAVAVLAFVFHWSNYIDALLYLFSEENYTLPLGLHALKALEPTNHPILLAAAVIATLPPIVGFLFVQRAFFSRILEVR